MWKQYTWPVLFWNVMVKICDAFFFFFFTIRVDTSVLQNNTAFYRTGRLDQRRYKKAWNKHLVAFKTLVPSCINSSPRPAVSLLTVREHLGQTQGYYHTKSFFALFLWTIIAASIPCEDDRTFTCKAFKTYLVYFYINLKSSRWKLPTLIWEAFIYVLYWFRLALDMKRKQRKKCQMNWLETIEKRRLFLILTDSPSSFVFWVSLINYVYIYICINIWGRIILEHIT